MVVHSPKPALRAESVERKKPGDWIRPGGSISRWDCYLARRLGRGQISGRGSGLLGAVCFYRHAAKSADAPMTIPSRRWFQFAEVVLSSCAFSLVGFWLASRGIGAGLVMTIAMALGLVYAGVMKLLRP
jgi:hypothetical protein